LQNFSINQFETPQAQLTSTPVRQLPRAPKRARHQFQTPPGQDTSAIPTQIQIIPATAVVAPTTRNVKTPADLVIGAYDMYIKKFGRYGVF